MVMDTRPAAVIARIDFVEFGSGLVTVDARPVSARPGRARAPFTLEAFFPLAFWTAPAGSALRRWATASSQVRVELRPGREGPQARISDDRSTVLLDLRRLPVRWSACRPSLPAGGRLAVPGGVLPCPGS